MVTVEKKKFFYFIKGCCEDKDSYWGGKGVYHTIWESFLLREAVTQKTLLIAPVILSPMLFTH